MGVKLAIIAKHLGEDMKVGPQTPLGDIHMLARIFVLVFVDCVLDQFESTENGAVLEGIGPPVLVLIKILCCMRLCFD